MAKIEGVVASFKDATLSNTVGQVAYVSRWNFSDYTACYGRLFDAHQLAGMLSDGRS